MSFRTAAVLCNPGASVSRDTSQPELQHRRSGRRQFEAVLEPPRSPARLFTSRDCTLPGNVGSHLRRRRPVFLHHDLGLRQTVVRPHHCVQNHDSIRQEHSRRAREVCRCGEHPQEIWRETGMEVWRDAELGACNCQLLTVEEGCEE